MYTNYLLRRGFDILPHAFVYTYKEKGQDIFVFTGRSTLEEMKQTEGETKCNQVIVNRLSEEMYFLFFGCCL